jgi:hypothetical protein
MSSTPASNPTPHAPGQSSQQGAPMQSNCSQMWPSVSK